MPVAVLKYLTDRQKNRSVGQTSKEVVRRVSEKSRSLIFMITLANMDQFSNFSLLISEMIVGGRQN